jgi:signal transduction histidine kinase
MTTRTSSSHVTSEEALKDEARLLEEEYVSALRTYLHPGDELSLNRAYELGRRAMIDGLGVLDMAAIHGAAVASLVIEAPDDQRARRARAAAAFFNELLSPFEMSFRGYRAANEELQRLNDSLRRQKDAVESANRELESFSYSVSHDLRAPLRSIDGFSQILLRDFSEVLGEAGARHLLRVRDSAQRMGQLIDDLLSLARVARSEVHRTDVDLSALARTIAERLRVTAPERDCLFTIEDGLHAKADERLVAIVLENLLGNAWKFTSKRPQARISFGGEPHGGELTYVVRDNGAGFDMAYAGKLFGAFQRLHSNKEFEGTGIGLATVQRVVQRHSGKIWAEGSVNCGAAFFFTLGDSRGSP